jgi:hypothetical protein
MLRWVRKIAVIVGLSWDGGIFRRLLPRDEKPQRQGCKISGKADQCE